MMYWLYSLALEPDMEIVAGTAGTPVEPNTQNWGTTCCEGRTKGGKNDDFCLQEEAPSHDEAAVQFGTALQDLAAKQNEAGSKYDMLQP